MLTLIKSVHGMNAVESHNLTQEQVDAVCRVMRAVYIHNPDYMARQDGGSPFLQGCHHPNGGTDGWILIEFWSSDKAAMQRFTDYLNSELGYEA